MEKRDTPNPAVTASLAGKGRQNDPASATKHMAKTLFRPSATDAVRTDRARSLNAVKATAMIRQRNAVYSKRKYYKKKRQVEQMEDVVRELTFANKHLQTDNARLESLLDDAQQQLHILESVDSLVDDAPLSKQSFPRDLGHSIDEPTTTNVTFTVSDDDGVRLSSDLLPTGMGGGLLGSPPIPLGHHTPRVAATSTLPFRSQPIETQTFHLPLEQEQARSHSSFTTLSLRPDFHRVANCASLAQLDSVGTDLPLGMWSTSSGSLDTCPINQEDPWLSQHVASRQDQRPAPLFMSTFASLPRQSSPLEQQLLVVLERRRLNLQQCHWQQPERTPLLPSQHLLYGNDIPMHQQGLSRVETPWQDRYSAILQTLSQVAPPQPTCL